ncbi:MAG: Panacea domain-containing protein [Solirubrobacterales bacterium]
MSSHPTSAGLRPDADARLRELVIYVAQKSQGDENYGNVKLNKLLYFSDFLAFQRLGASISGAKYRKREHGPCPEQMRELQAEMESDGDIRLVDRPIPGARSQVRVVPLRDPKDIFSTDERALVDEVIEKYRDFTGRKIEQESHDVPAWKVAREREFIPYATALIETGPLTEDVLEIARRRYA